MCDGIGGGGKDSGDFARIVASNLGKIDFSTVSPDQVQSKIDAVAESATKQLKNNNPKLMPTGNTGCTLAMTAKLADGQLYSITAGDSHVWGYDQNGERVFSSIIDSVGDDLLRKIEYYKKINDKENLDFFQSEYNEMDKQQRERLNKSISYLYGSGIARIELLPDNVTHSFTLSDGYDKLGRDTPKFDELISKLIKAGKSAVEIQAEVVKFWQNGLALPNADKLGFGRDDFSFVSAEIK